MTTRAAPKVTRAAVEYLLDVGPGSTIVRDLSTRRTFPHPADGVDPFTQPTWIVLVTHDEAVYRATEHRGNVSRIVRDINRELYVQAARGEIPTLDELTEALAAMEHYLAQVVELFPVDGVAAELDDVEFQLRLDELVDDEVAS